MNIRHITALTALLAAAVAASAVAPDYDAVVADALRTGYGVRPDSLRMAAEAAAVLADNTPEGPEAEFEYLWNHDGDEGRWSVGISQSFDWPGAYSARRRQAEAIGFAAEASARTAALDKALEIKLLVIDIVNARRRRDLLAHTRDNVVAIDSLTRLAYKRESATALDIRKSALARLDIERELALADADIDALAASLAAQGVDADTRAWVDYPRQTIHPDRLAPEMYPEYHAAVARARASRAGIDALRRSTLPSLSLGVAHAYEDHSHFTGLTLGLRLPSWSRKQRERAATLEAEAIAAESGAAVSIARAQTAGLHDTALRLRDELDAYRSITGDDSYLRLLEKSYTAGQINFINYMTELNLFTEARLRFLDLEYRYQLTLARLNKPRSAYFN